jgi:hypothetical protein
MAEGEYGRLGVWPFRFREAGEDALYGATKTGVIIRESG